MKNAAILFLVLVAVGASANWLVTWNPNSFVVPNRTVKAIESVNPDAADGRTDAVVVDTLPVGFDVGTYKWDGSALVPLTQADFDAIAATNAALQLQARIDFTNSVRVQAKAALDEFRGEQELLIRAVALALLDIDADTRARAGYPAIARATLKNQVLLYLTNGVADSIE